MQDYSNTGLIQIGPPTPMMHNSHNLPTAPIPHPTSSPSSALIGHHHTLIYHAPNPNEWYHTGSSAATADTVNALNHFSHHHHHHLVHHGPTTAY